MFTGVFCSFIKHNYYQDLQYGLSVNKALYNKSIGKRRISCVGIVFKNGHLYINTEIGGGRVISMFKTQDFG